MSFDLGDGMDVENQSATAREHPRYDVTAAADAIRGRSGRSAVGWAAMVTRGNVALCLEPSGATCGEELDWNSHCILVVEPSLQPYGSTRTRGQRKRSLADFRLRPSADVTFWDVGTMPMQASHE